MLYLQYNTLQHKVESPNWIIPISTTAASAPPQLLGSIWNESHDSHDSLSYSYTIGAVSTMEATPMASSSVYTVYSISTRPSFPPKRKTTWLYFPLLLSKPILSLLSLVIVVAPNKQTIPGSFTHQLHFLPPYPCCLLLVCLPSLFSSLLIPPNPLPWFTLPEFSSVSPPYPCSLILLPLYILYSRLFSPLVYSVLTVPPERLYGGLCL